MKELLDKKRAAGALPVNVAAEKSRLRRMLEEASASNNAEEVARCAGVCMCMCMHMCVCVRVYAPVLELLRSCARPALLYCMQP